MRGVYITSVHTMYTYIVLSREFLRVPSLSVLSSALPRCCSWLRFELAVVVRGRGSYYPNSFFVTQGQKVGNSYPALIFAALVCAEKHLCSKGIHRDKFILPTCATRMPKARHDTFDRRASGCKRAALDK